MTYKPTGGTCGGKDLDEQQTRCSPLRMFGVVLQKFQSQKNSSSLLGLPTNTPVCDREMRHWFETERRKQGSPSPGLWASSSPWIIRFWATDPQ